MSIASELNRLLQAKADLKTAIEAKGVSVPAATTLDGYAALVGQIQTGPVLPYDAEIEWIESTGTQFINTGISYGTNDVVNIYLVGSFTTLNSTNQLMGVYGGAYFGVSNSNKFCAGSVSNAVMNANTNNNTFSFTATIGNSKNVILGINGTAQTFTRNNSAGTAYLFNLSGGSFPCKFRLKSGRVGKNNVRIHDFIPVRVGQVGYLYDTITKTLFGNDGTGNFTLGPDVT